MPKAYLTIDDSPGPRTRDMVNFLNARDIQALFFCRGDQMAEDLHSIIYAIENGQVIGNHSYAHKPAGEMSTEEWFTDFEACEALIEDAYETAGVKRPGHYYRFPYIDRGDRERVERAFAEGQGGDFTENAQTQRLQNVLKSRGFVQPFAGMNTDYPSSAADCLFTYTTGDWMLTDRHRGQWAYKSAEDLKTKIEDDIGLRSPGNHVILAHDQAEIFDESCALIDHFIAQGFEFLDLGCGA